jgi:hypothetical protein
MSKLAISSLIKTGFSKENIQLICYDDDHSIYFKNKYGIRTKTCSVIPKKFKKMFTQKGTTKKYFFYKPIAFYHEARCPIDDNTVMCYSDVDAIFKKNPTKFILSQKTDVWTPEGVILPRRRKLSEGKVVNPKMTYDSLKEFYWKCGGGALAHLHLKYKWDLDRQSHFTNFFAVKPHVYTSLIERWYEMCEIVLQRDDQEKGDQEIFTAALWSLGLSHSRSPRLLFKNKYCNQYECGAKKHMAKDYKKIMGAKKK